MLPFFMLMLACGDDPVMQGQVQDIWGNPIQGATVMLVGQEQVKTDANGRYEIKRVTGEHEFKVGHTDYIQDVQTATIAEEGGAPSFELFEKAEENGFYVIGQEGYLKLDTQPVLNKGNQLKTIYGIESLGEAESYEDELRLVLKSDLKFDEIARLGLELHQLEFTQEVMLPGPLGAETPTKVNLYTSGGTVPVKIDAMGSKDHYMVTPKEAVEGGNYAFQTQSLLNPKNDEAFAKIPENLRVVFPVTLENK